MSERQGLTQMMYAWNCARCAFSFNGPLTCPICKSVDQVGALHSKKAEQAKLPKRAVLLKECHPKATGGWWPTHCWQVPRPSAEVVPIIAALVCAIR